MPEARLERRGEGAGPAAEGWYVLNVRDARWFEVERADHYAALEGEEHRFPQLGVNVGVLQPGKPGCLYHREDAQEDFLVVSGDAILAVEGQTRALRPWDLFYCPPGTNHVLVGGDEPCVVVAVGARPAGAIVYPVDETAARFGASAERETDSPQEAYASWPAPNERAYRVGDLPELG